MDANNDDSNSSQSQGPEDEDRLSMLTDDVLLSILLKVGLRMAARTSVLSTRWRHLPWLLPELSINVKDFLSDPDSDPIEANDMEEAMVSSTKAARSFLSKSREGFTISRLQVKLYLIDTFLFDIGPLVGDAIDSDLLRDLDLAVLDETDPIDCSEEDMLQRAREIEGVFSACPSVLRCLTKLSLYHVSFDKSDMRHVLFECCKHLKHLSLTQCDTGPNALFKIDAPNSKLTVLELDKCRFERLELVCLPKLEKLRWFTWVWMQPEMKQLCTAFNKLRKLSVCGIFVEFDILWMMALLAAAPCIEILHIEVWEHACDLDDEDGRRYFHERRTPQWDMQFDETKNCLLKELEFVGFKLLEQQFTFIRSILERSPNLQKIVLKGDEQCEYCDALDGPPSPSKFPKKDEQEMVVEQIRDGIFSPQIIFDQ
ncbi:uncharacterized protein LOC106866866 [Brachypodium distachyon]|uniref:uncharacterized protein LOC106866866 n=1 Tax=Brachypodium distachyon TaxID=15368 RepID=UPI00071CA141|nr:uncharacterized protein LOC106866866 [Brachypodium distachyon]|eukprot:XP_014758605.1 uncharacterized protein LOC106866866 [Brachypodium distachyon]